MKYQIELNCIDGQKFLNYWDSIHGNDVVCAIVDGKLILDDDNAKEITIDEFIDLVEQTSTEGDEIDNSYD